MKLDVPAVPTDGHTLYWWNLDSIGEGLIQRKLVFHRGPTPIHEVFGDFYRDSKGPPLHFEWSGWERYVPNDDCDERWRSCGRHHQADLLREHGPRGAGIEDGFATWEEARDVLVDRLLKRCKWLNSEKNRIAVIHATFKHNALKAFLPGGERT